MRCIASKFLNPEAQEALGIHNVKPNGSVQQGVQVKFPDGTNGKDKEATKRLVSDAAKADSPTCLSCGNLMQRNGSCYVCTACGATSGCS